MSYIIFYRDWERWSLSYFPRELFDMVPPDRCIVRGEVARFARCLRQEYPNEFDAEWALYCVEDEAASAAEREREESFYDDCLPEEREALESRRGKLTYSPPSEEDDFDIVHVAGRTFGWFDMATARRDGSPFTVPMSVPSPTIIPERARELPPPPPRVRKDRPAYQITTRSLPQPGVPNGQYLMLVEREVVAFLSSRFGGDGECVRLGYVPASNLSAGELAHIATRTQMLERGLHGKHLAETVERYEALAVGDLIAPLEQLRSLTGKQSPDSRAIIPESWDPPHPLTALLDRLLCECQEVVGETESKQWPRRAGRAAGGRQGAASEGRTRAAAPRGWIFINDATAKYEVSSSTLHGWVSGLETDEKVKDEDSAQVRVLVSKLEEILRKKGRLPG